MKNCQFCGSRSTVVRKNDGGGAAWVMCCVCGAEGPMRQTEEEAAAAWDDALRYAPTATGTGDFPQDPEPNEYRYISPAWLDAIAYGLTKGAEKHPNETWRTIPARENAWRAVRHLVMWLAGDREDPHLINAAMRVMFTFETDKAENGGGDK